jgi:dolichol-phosphate mannosyltransferase
MFTITVVIAAYNESQNIGNLTERLIQALDSIPDSSWKLIYVIEGNDGTIDLVREFASRRAEIEVYYNEQPSGLGNAFRRGFDAVPSDTDFVVTMDADLNHQPEEIPRLLAATREFGADIVVGSRRLHGSSFEGAPLWKTAISRSVNRMTQVTMGLRVGDLTSGFRVYRASALRRIKFHNTGFAFLPEILVRAAALRMKIVEQPIRFVFRTSGESKMRIASTSLSYLKLLARHSVSVSTWLAMTLLLIGLGVRIAFCFPPHKSHVDSDAILSGLCALDVTHGSLPLFDPGGYRISSQACYVNAGMFYFFGPTRSALAATSVLYGFIFLVFGWLALREAAGPRAAIPGLLLLVFPPLQFWLVTYPLLGYASIMAASACTMWLGFRLLRPSLTPSLITSFLFGISVGFSFWTSPQTIMISVPIIAMLACKKCVSWRSGLLLALGALLSLWPYFIVLARQGVSPFLTSFATQPVSGMTQLASNAAYLFTYNLPVLFFSGAAQQILVLSLVGMRVLLIGFGLASLTVFVVRRSMDADTGHSRILVFLPLGILLFGCAVYVGSGAGCVRGWTVRYVAPLYLAISLAASLLYRQVNKRRAKAIVLIGAAMLAGLQIREYPMFQSGLRQSQVAALAGNRATISWLQKNNRDVAIGNYWTVYFLNFDSLRSVIALPINADDDYFQYSRELQTRQARTALIDQDATHLESWIKRLGRSGHTEKITGNIMGFIVDDPLDAKAVEETRASAR